MGGMTSGVIAVLFALLLSVSGCGDSQIAGDAGVEADARPADRDANTAPDGAVEPDAAVEIDAGGRRVLLEPPEGVLHGVGPYDAVEDAYVAALDDPAIEPAVRASFFAIPGVDGRTPLPEGVGGALARARATGRIPQIGLSFTVGSDEPTDDEVAAGEHDALLDAVAERVRDHGDPIFVRPGFEFNGAWNGYTPGVYVQAFRRVVDRFRAAGADNVAFIWCYEPDAPDDFDAVDASGDALWYPGDDYVDWFGLDVFSAHHFVPDADRSTTEAWQRADRFLTMARDHGRPVFLAETAAVKVDVTPDSDDPGLADGMADWEAWFSPFVQWMEAHPEIKGFIYLDQDFRGSPWDHWGDTRIEVNSYILGRWREELRRDRYIHLGSDEL